MTHPPVCLTSQQPDTGGRGEMERAAPSTGDFQNAITRRCETAAETCTDVVWEEGG